MPGLLVQARTVHTRAGTTAPETKAKTTMTDEQILDKIQKILREAGWSSAKVRQIEAVLKHRRPRGWMRIFKP
jgi:hypothetical protein